MEEKVNELNDKRKLATIAKIEEIKSIPGADNIEYARVRGWWIVVKKDQFKVNDLCIYVEVDSILPDGLPEEKKEEWRSLNKLMSKAVTDEERNELRNKMQEISSLNTRPEFEFLRSVKFHIKTRRILGRISQGICFPLEILENIGKFQSVCDDRFNTVLCLNIPINENTTIPIVENEDLTDALGIVQYVAPDPAVMGGDAVGTLTATGCLVSDEERLENLSGKYETLKNYIYFKTEKLEGTSFLAYLKNGKFGVCGRTVDFKVPDEDDPFEGLNSYWKTAIRLDIENKMRKYAIDHWIEYNWAIQGELVGEGIQGNIYKLKGQTVCFYNAFNIDTQTYWPFNEFVDAIKEMGLTIVPILNDNYVLPENSIDILNEADITTTVFGNNPNQLIEGFVFVAHQKIENSDADDHYRITRSDFGRISFKGKSRIYDMHKK